MSKSFSPSRLEDHLGYWLRCLSNFVSDGFADCLAGHDISVAQGGAAGPCTKNGGVALNEAAQLVGVDKSPPHGGTAGSGVV